MQGGLILCYHRINNDSHSYLQLLGKHFRIEDSEYSRIIPSTKVENFEKQMRYLSRFYHPVPLEDIVQHIRNGTSPPPKSVAITFDDGYRDNYDNAYPILKKYGIPATIFLTTGYIDTDEIPWWDKVYYVLSQAKEGEPLSTELPRAKFNEPFNKKSIKRVIQMLKQLEEKEKKSIIAELTDQRDLKVNDFAEKNLMLSWEEVREMSNNGISFGAHTLTHPLLPRVPSDQARDEIYISKDIIEQQIGKSVNIFAYPGGDFDVHIEKMVKNAGYFAAVSSIPGYNHSETNIYALKRNGIRLSNRIEFFPIFKVEVTGVLGHLMGFYDRIRQFI